MLAYLGFGQGGSAWALFCRLTSVPFCKLASLATLGAVDLRSGEERTKMHVRRTGAAVTARNGPAARDLATRAHIADLQVRAAVAAGYVARMGSSDPVVRAAAHTEWNDVHVVEVSAAKPVVGDGSSDRPSPVSQMTQGSGPRTDMGGSEPLAADLAVITRAIDNADVDLKTQLDCVVAAARSAVTSYLGMTLTIYGDGQAVSVTARDALATGIATSLLIPLTRGSSAGPSPTLILYAARSGAFVDLAADVGHALGLHHTALVFDEHLSGPSEGSGVIGRATQSAVNQAIGVLLDRGNTAEAARDQLRRGAGGSGDEMRIVAEQVLLSANALTGGRRRYLLGGALLRLAQWAA